MSILTRIVKFVARESAQPFLEAVGAHIGDALGTVLGRKIDAETNVEALRSDVAAYRTSDKLLRKVYRAALAWSRPDAPTDALTTLRAAVETAQKADV